MRTIQKTQKNSIFSELKKSANNTFSILKEFSGSLLSMVDGENFTTEDTIVMPKALKDNLGLLSERARLYRENGSLPNNIEQEDMAIENEISSNISTRKRNVNTKSRTTNQTHNVQKPVSTKKDLEERDR